MYRFVLYLSREELRLNGAARENSQKLSELLDNMLSRRGDDFSGGVRFLEDMSGEDVDALLESVRILSRKCAVGVVTKDGSGPLPISRNKHPGRAGILVCSKDGTPIAVYPHTANKKRMEIEPYLTSLADGADPEMPGESSFLTEADIARMISTFPETIEDGLTFVAHEVEVEGGRIDSVFRDKNGRPLLVEIEIYARSIAVEQALKFRFAYARKYGLDPKEVRTAIVCGRIKDSTLRASAAGNVEVYELSLKKVA